jgi:hypothetical protein
MSWAPVVHTYNLSYSGDSNQENRSSKPAQANSLPYLEKIHYKNKIKMLVE